MKEITVKYSGECKKCGETIPVGEQAIYEKRVGIFHIDCAPVDTEEIRALRQEAADRKADRFDEWAKKREEKANRQLNNYSEIRHDIAFNTQPGHIPFRARMIKADNRAFESLEVASRMRGKAKSLRHVRVAGDAEKRREQQREFVRSRIFVGQEVETIYGKGIVEKVNKKTAKIGKTGSSGNYTVNVDLSCIDVLNKRV